MAKAKPLRKQPALSPPAKGSVIPAAPPPSDSSILSGERGGVFVLFILTLFAYWPALHAGFIWDDDSFLTENPLIRASDGLYRFWFTTEPTDYWPITSTSLWFEWRLWGLHAAGYHIVNVALHLFEVGLLWRILKKLRVPGAFIAAALFALHPVNVESVAWITQRKNLMAMLFFLLSILLFLRTEELPISNTHAEPKRGFGRWYWFSLFAFALAMLAKGSVALLPVVLIGVIAWQRPLRWNDAFRLAPFFAVAVGLAVVNVLFQNHDSDEIIRIATLGQRLLGAGAVVWFYLGKAILPYPLSFVYPEWQINVHDVLWWIPTIAAVGVSLALWHFRRGRARPFFFAWGYFCVSLIPVLGLTDIYFMKYSLVADHYQHLALIAVCVMVGAGLGLLRDKKLPTLRIAAQALAVGIILIFAGTTWAQSRIYRDNETLFRATIERNPECWMAYNNLGKLLAEQGQQAEAVKSYEQALQIKPTSAEAHNNLAMELASLGQTDQAIAHFEEALRIRPRYPEVHVNLAAVLHTQRRINEARIHLEEAVRLRPNYAKAHDDLGNIYDTESRPDDAIKEYEQALHLESTSLPAHVNLANVFFKLGRLDEAIAHYEQALRLSPDYEPACKRLGLALAEKGRLPDALAQLEKSVRLAPNDPEAHNALGMVLANTNQPDLALSHFERAVQLRPNYTQARANLEQMRARAGKY